MLAAASACLVAHPLAVPSFHTPVHATLAPTLFSRFLGVLCALVAAGITVQGHGDVAFLDVDDFVAAVKSSAAPALPGDRRASLRRLP